MTKPTDSLTVSLRVTRAVPESWLVGALLILFGVAVTAAIPPISAAIRGALAAQNATQSTERADRKVSIRLRFVSVRLVEPRAPEAGDVPAAPDSLADVGSNHVEFVRPGDLAAQIRLRGFSARAPPALIA